MSPLSTHVHQLVPYICFVRLPVNARIIHIEVEYFEKDVVRECADRYPSVELVCAAHKSVIMAREAGGSPLTLTLFDC